MKYLTKIKVKPKGQNTHPNEVVLALLQALASVERDFVYLDRKHYNIKGTSWMERPFHFEFYHQLRLKFKKQLKRHKIQAEIEKASHSSGVGNKRPDLIFHIPGNRNEPAQLMHIEIKTAKLNDITQLKEIIEDLEKLCDFKDKLGYNISVLVLFGPSDELLDTILFIEGNDAHNRQLNEDRDKIIKRIRNERKEIFLIELDTSILE